MQVKAHNTNFHLIIVNIQYQSLGVLDINIVYIYSLHTSASQEDSIDVNK